MPGLHIQAVYRRTRVSGAEDVAVTTHDLWYAQTDDPTDAQCNSAAAEFITFWTDLCNATSGIISAQTTLIELRFYKGYDGDGSPGEVDLVKTYSQSGLVSGNMCPPQVACTVTEMPYRQR